MQVLPIETRVFLENEDIVEFICEHIKEIKEESVIAVTSKIVALAEGRTAEYVDENTKVELICEESEKAIETKWCWLTVKDGILMPSAGIDESNSEGKLILLPRDSYDAAEMIREALMKKFNLMSLGVILTDSRVMPFRAGVTGVPLGYAGIKGIRDYVGCPDIFGRPMKMSRTNVVDSLSTTAVLLMGECAEQIPLVVIEDAPVEFCDTVDRHEVDIDIEDDLYRPFFGNSDIS